MATEKGYDVVVDSLFGEPFAALLKSGTLSANSRVVILGSSAGQDVNLNFRELQAAKGATFAGYSTFYAPADVQRAAYLAMAEHVMAGDIHVDIKSFPLAEAEAAWAAQTAGPHAKIIVTV